MSTTEPPKPSDQSKAEDIPLEDIERLLEAEDPEFTKELEAVKAVENNPEDHIESAVAVEEENSGTDKKPLKVSRIQKLRTRFRMWVLTVKEKLKERSKTLGKDILVFLKTKPKEYILYSIAMIKILVKQAGTPVRIFRNASNAQRITTLILALVGTLAFWVLLSNLRGIWLPLLNEPILASLQDHAEWTESFDAKDGSEGFYSAFPQEIHEFLFQRMKVNLKAASDSPNPMGAFEVIVQVDSKDTAIELRDREVEFFDGLQRVFEEETFNDLESDLGKGKLKSRIKRELNQKLTQGWIKDVKFKTFILKP